LGGFSLLSVGLDGGLFSHPLLVFLQPARLDGGLFGRPLLRSLLPSGPGLGALFVPLLLLAALFLHLVTFAHPSHRMQAGWQWLCSHLTVGQEPLAARLGCPQGHDPAQ